MKSHEILGFCLTPDLFPNLTSSLFQRSREVQKEREKRERDREQEQDRVGEKREKEKKEIVKGNRRNSTYKLATSFVFGIGR